MPAEERRPQTSQEVASESEQTKEARRANGVDQDPAEFHNAIARIDRGDEKRDLAIREIQILLSEMAQTDPTAGLSWAAKERLKSDHHFWQLERKENSLQWKREAALRLAIQTAIASSLITACVGAAAAHFLGARL